jgi:hypothetical protein
MAKWDAIEKHARKKKGLLVNGIWIQNVNMQKMNLHMFNYKCPPTT